MLKHANRAQRDTLLGKGQLIVIPAGAGWGRQLSLRSEELVLLEVAQTAAAAASRSVRPGSR